MNNQVLEICKDCAHVAVCINKNTMEEAIKCIKWQMEHSQGMNRDFDFVNRMIKAGIKFKPECAHYISRDRIDDNDD